MLVETQIAGWFVVENCPVMKQDLARETRSRGA